MNITAPQDHGERDGRFEPVTFAFLCAIIEPQTSSLLSKIQIWNKNLNIGPEFELSSPVIEAAGWLHHLVPHRSLSLLRHKITFLSNPFSHETNHFL